MTTFGLGSNRLKLELQVGGLHVLGLTTEHSGHSFILPLIPGQNLL